MGIVQAHNGSLSVASEGEGCGSVFTLELHLAQSEERYERPVLERGSSFGFKYKLSRNSSSSSLGNRALLRMTSMTRSCQKVSPVCIGCSDHDEISVTSNNKEEIDISSDEFKIIDNPISNLNILFVDDVKLNRSMLIRLLRARLSSYSEAENGIEAIEKVHNSIIDGKPFDMLLMDSNMPKMDGLTASRRIREMKYEGLIIGVTGNGLQEDINNFKSNGADYVLVKPLNINEFDKIINNDKRLYCNRK